MIVGYKGQVILEFRSTISFLIDILNLDALPPVANCSCVRFEKKGGLQMATVTIQYNFSKLAVIQSAMKRQ